MAIVGGVPGFSFWLWKSWVILLKVKITINFCGDFQRKIYLGEARFILGTYKFWEFGGLDANIPEVANLCLALFENLR